jgi:hypothetical protein
MAYTPLNETKPVITDTRQAIVDAARTNALALLHAVIGGTPTNERWSYTYTTGTAALPTTIVLTNASDANKKVKIVLTYNGNYPATMKVYYTSTGDSGYDLLNASDLTFTYSGSEISGGYHGSFLLGKMMWALGYIRDLQAYLSAHAALTGSAAHGLGTISTQAATAVNIDGGSIDGTTIGGAAAAAATFTRASEQSNTYTPSSGAGVTVDWAKGASQITNSGTNALTWSNIPGSVLATHFLYVSNLNSTTFPASVTWGANGKPSVAGAALVSLVTWNGPSPGTNQVYATCVWRAV